MSELATKTLLVCLSVHAWRGKKINRDAAEKAAVALGATPSSDEFYTHLVPKDAHKALRSYSAALRLTHWRYTFPWLDNGARLLPSSAYFRYCQEMHELRDQYLGAADDFCAAYGRYKEFAQANRGALFREEDYPTAEEVRSQFAVDVTFLPFPNVADFRVDIGEEEVKKLKEQLAAQQKAMMEFGIDELRSRLQTRLSAIETMTTPGSGRRIHSGVLSAFNEAVEITKLLNVTNDPTLAAVVSACNSWLTTVSAETLRNNTAATERAYQAAKEILEMLNG